MATGASLVGCAYALLAAVAAASQAHAAPASWGWLAAFFVIFTTGELFILPVGLSLFGRLAPINFAATTIASWFLAGFAGNLLAGVLGTLWSSTRHSSFFMGIAGLAFVASALLLTFDARVRRVELEATADPVVAAG